MEGYRRVNANELVDGQEVIVETKHYEYKRGYPVESTYYRAIVGHHKTVSGVMAHLTNEPNVEWPSFAPWQGRWIYAGNDAVTTMWVKL